MAARTGATLTGESISSVASRSPSVSGRIGGDIADRSLSNYMPHLSGRNMNGTQITGGQISTTAIGANGQETSVQMYNAAMYDRPESPHSVVRASDGTSWYQTATGAGMSDFYSPSATFTGDVSEAAQVSASFPTAAEGTTLRSVDDGVIEATSPDGSNSMWYNSAIYQQPDAPHDTVTAANGVNWYSTQPYAETPQFETGAASMSGPGASYNQAQFQQFMPGYEQQAAYVDASRTGDGVLEIRHQDGSGTAFYDSNMYKTPRGDHHVYEDNRGGQWYGVQGTPTIERRPVYENGRPVYDGDTLRTVNVENIKYNTTPDRFGTPDRRDINEHRPPRRRQ
jgi:hypothetical protein